MSGRCEEESEKAYLKQVLNTFRHRGEGREAISEPFSHGDYTFATCGRIIVAIPRMDEFQGVGNYPKITPEGFSFLPPENGKWERLPKIPEVQKCECELCAGEGVVSCDCPRCDGYGYGHDCNNCDGEGSIIDIDTVQIGIYHYSNVHLKKINLLEDVKIYPITDKGGSRQMCFTFKGGSGCVMGHMDKKVSKVMREQAYQKGGENG